MGFPIQDRRQAPSRHLREIPGARCKQGPRTGGRVTRQGQTRARPGWHQSQRARARERDLRGVCQKIPGLAAPRGTVLHLQGKRTASAEKPRALAWIAYRRHGQAQHRRTTDRLATEVGPVQANRTRASLSKFLNWCLREGLIESNQALLTNVNEEKERPAAYCPMPNLWKSGKHCRKTITAQSSRS